MGMMRERKRCAKRCSRRVGMDGGILSNRTSQYQHHAVFNRVGSLNPARSLGIELVTLGAQMRNSAMTRWGIWRRRNVTQPPRCRSVLDKLMLRGRSIMRQDAISLCICTIISHRPIREDAEADQTLSDLERHLTNSMTHSRRSVEYHLYRAGCPRATPSKYTVVLT